MFPKGEGEKPVESNIMPSKSKDSTIAAGLTPTDMMRQYQRIKAQYQDAILLFRFGDFYEMFFDDAERMARELQLVLTSRPQGKGMERVPMCGIPFYRVDGYLARLIGRGHKVAICEQLEDASLAKRLVERGVVRVVTPGTLYEVGEGETFLVALLPTEQRVGVVWLELSTGEFFGTESWPAELPSLFAKFPPRELLVPTGQESWAAGLRSWMQRLPPVTVREWSEFAPDHAKAALQTHFGVERVDAFGFYEGEPVLRAAGALFRYVQETQKEFLPHVKALRPYRPSDFLVLDASTQRNLELTESLFDHRTEGSLFAVLDRTVTGMGRRRLKFWVLHPLLSGAEIARRQDAIAELIASLPLRQGIRAQLRCILDLERLTSRLTSQIARPRDIIGLKTSLAALPELCHLLEEVVSSILSEIKDQLDPLTDVGAHIDRTLLDDPKASLTDGGLIRDGVSETLDEARALMNESQQALAGLEHQERERTHIQSLKVGFNKIFGYYLEITKPNLKLVPPEYIRKQTVAVGERFITPALQHLEAKILTATEHSKNLEHELFCVLRRWVADQGDRLRRVADLLATLDALVSLAETAAASGWRRPEVTEDFALQISEGRHPTVETTGSSFVPNDLELTAERFLLIVTGPNMAGKSTYARQAALLVLLAQVGSYIPAQAARIGIVDRIFTRVGAADLLARGMSTFMLEMTETAHILRHATARSLIILDEIGRGTGTADGLAIARAVIAYLVRRIGAKTLFTTHYHEVTTLASTLEAVSNACLQVRDDGGDVTFLFKVLPGVSSRSYGIHVARLAGLPEEVVTQAAALLGEPISLPLQIPEIAAAPAPRRDASPSDPVEERLRRIDPLHTTPFEALQLLHELRERVVQGATAEQSPSRAPR
jgi:DNA mismatch repair protein MutS